MSSVHRSAMANVTGPAAILGSSRKAWSNVGKVKPTSGVGERQADCQADDQSRAAIALPEEHNRRHEQARCQTEQCCRPRPHATERAPNHRQLGFSTRNAWIAIVIDWMLTPVPSPSTRARKKASTRLFSSDAAKALVSQCR